MNAKELFKKALVELQSNRPLKAIEIVDKIADTDTHISDALLIRGISYMRLKDYDNALLNFENIIKINPKYKDAYFNLASIYKKKNKLYKALEYLDKLTNIDKLDFKAFSNKCFIKIILRDFKNALKDINKSLDINPNYLNGYLQRGNIYKELKLFDKSEKDYDFIIKSSEKNSNIYYEATYNKSQLLLLNGSFKTGFKLYESRFNLNEYYSTKIIKNEKKIISLNLLQNKIVLVIGEQGIGDNIQFSRYLKLLKAKCLKIIFCVDKKMKVFFEKLKIADMICTSDDKIGYYDYNVHLMSLPHLFNTDHLNVPEINFNIHPDNLKLKLWQNIIKPYQKFFKIGINTTSNKNIPGRDIPLNYFKNISKFNKLKLFNLQKNFDDDLLNKEFDILKFNNFDEKELFQDSKALIKSLDLVITCDTSIAHLAASMNKQTWVLLNDVPEWRWLLNTDKSLWYKNISLFRCKVKDDWSKPINEIESLLIKYN